MAASLAVMMSVFGAVNGNILVGPRLPYAMAQDGLAPRVFAKLHERFRTPTFATALLAAWSVAMGVVWPIGKGLVHLWSDPQVGSRVAPVLAYLTLATM